VAVVSRARLGAESPPAIIPPMPIALRKSLRLKNTSSSVAALSGIGLALAVYAGYVRRRGRRVDPLERAKPVHTLLSQKYYVDTLYEDVIVRIGFLRVIAGTLDWIDRNLVDGIVDLIGWFFRNIGTAIGKFQTGQVQAYATGIAFGILAIILALLLA